MVPHSFKIPIRPLPLDSTVLGSSSCVRCLEYLDTNSPTSAFYRTSEP